VRCCRLPVCCPFGGLHANLALAEHLPVAGSINAVSNLTVPIAAGVTPAGATAAIAELRRRPVEQLLPSVSPAAVTGLKFNECLPLQQAMRTLAGRLADPPGIAQVLNAPIVQVRGPDAP
jgi:ATP-dependent Lhr-like helicase